LKLRKVVIPAAGLGTRLLPATKAQPKEMLPLFVHVGGQTMLKPLLHVVFERLYEEGFREFCFITGRGKRAIEDYFTTDNGAVKALGKSGGGVVAREMMRFYRMVDKAQIVWLNQPEPRGFGDAVHRAYAFTGDEPFLLHNGDTYIHS
jgi:UTP--glucose-1-phosphate uridylyltransferase